MVYVKKDVKAKITARAVCQAAPDVDFDKAVRKLASIPGNQILDIDREAREVTTIDSTQFAYVSAYECEDCSVLYPKYTMAADCEASHKED